MVALPAHRPSANNALKVGTEDSCATFISQLASSAAQSPYELCYTRTPPPPAPGAAQSGRGITGNLVGSRLDLVGCGRGSILGLVQDALAMLCLEGEQGRAHVGGGGSTVRVWGPSAGRAEAVNKGPIWHTFPHTAAQCTGWSGGWGPTQPMQACCAILAASHNLHAHGARSPLCVGQTPCTMACMYRQLGRPKTHSISSLDVLGCEQLPRVGGLDGRVHHLKRFHTGVVD